MGLMGKSKVTMWYLRVFVGLCKTYYASMRKTCSLFT